MSERNRKPKTRTRNNRRGSRSRRPNPRRRGPGVLLTCERGREAKCLREGLDILRHYLGNQPNKDNEVKQAALSLEEEISMLQKGASSEQVLGDGCLINNMSEAFGVYETGCGGTVVIMCTLPDSALIDPIATEWSEASKSKRKASSGELDGGIATKRTRCEKQGTAAEKQDGLNIESQETGQSESHEVTGTGCQTLPQGTPLWDPVATVERVLEDLDSASTTAPSSRFVIRMIPVQATCFASVEEIGLTSKALVNKCLKGKTPSTFAVAVKRRNCSTVTRDQVITAVAGGILDMKGATDAWTVDLKSPKYTVMVELCKTLCGVAIVENYASYRNFNLLEIREARQVTACDL